MFNISNFDWLLGREIISFGLGLDISGAIFLALSLLESSSSMASKLFYNVKEKKELNRAGKKEHIVSGTPIKEASKSMLLARVGLLSLGAGFLFQLIGTIVPSSNNTRIILPLLAAIFAFEISRRIGKNWIDNNETDLMKDIIRSPRVDSEIDLNAVRFGKKDLDWKEPSLIKFLKSKFTE